MYFVKELNKLMWDLIRLLRETSNSFHVPYSLNNKCLASLAT